MDVNRAVIRHDHDVGTIGFPPAKGFPPSVVEADAPLPGTLGLRAAKIPKKTMLSFPSRT
jgi:hypothetical protein